MSNSIINLDWVKELLASDITSYRIAKETNVPSSTVLRLRNGTNDVMNLSAKHLLSLQDYYLRQKSIKE